MDVRHTVVPVTRNDLALAALACAAVPGMRPVSVQEQRYPDHGGPGGARSALVEDATGRRWVVSAPRPGTAVADAEYHDPLVRQLGTHLPFKVPVAAGYVTLDDGGRAAVFPHIEGSAIDLHRLPAGPGLASAVGRAVAAVHNIPRGLFEECGAPVFDAVAHRERRLAVLDRAAETGHVPTGLLARWEQAFDSPALWQFATTAVHGSLDGWAFLVAFADNDAASGRVVALTGWGQAAVTDPAQDFSVLVDQAQPAAVDSVLESYALARSQRPDPHLLIRARLAAEMHLVERLTGAVATEDDRRVRACVEQLRKLDRLTSADDSLVPAEPERGGPVIQVSHEGASPELEPVATEHAQELEPEPDLEPEPEPDPGLEPAQEAGAAARSGADTETAQEKVVTSEAEPAETSVEVGGSPRTGSTRFTPDATPLQAPQDAAEEAGAEVAESEHVDTEKTQTLPVTRLGEGLDERTRLHDLYDVPEGVLPEAEEVDLQDGPSAQPDVRESG